MHGISLLEKHGCQWNAMAVVNDYNADYPLDFYRFFRDELKCKYLQFAPIVERVLPRADGRHLAHLQDRTRRWPTLPCVPTSGAIFSAPYSTNGYTTMWANFRTTV